MALVGHAVDLAAQGRIEEARAPIEEGKTGYPQWRESILPEWQIIVHWFGGDFRAALTCATEFHAGWMGDLSRRRADGVVFAALAAVEAGEIEQARTYLSATRRAFRRAFVAVLQPSAGIRPGNARLA